jgi:serine/threonine protein kinase
MSTYTSEPGTRLAGRYLLVDQASGSTDWTYWKAIDETLARSVTVLTLGAGFGRSAEVVAAARAASRLNDPRFSQVFDVEDADESEYVVLEWVVGESLLDMLADGPLDPPRAVSLVSEAAQALAAAHANGLAHLRLDPACVHWTPRGGIKITGLGIAAALTGGAQDPADDGEDPELADTHGLARLLYAALTGYWPEPRGYTRAFGPAEAPGPDGGLGSAPAVLPPAPLADGMPRTPRQVSADIPTNIDAVTCQALFQRPSRHGPALSTPAEFADALASVRPPASLPVPVPATAPVLPAAPARTPSYQPNYPAGPYSPADQARPTLDENAYRRPAKRTPPTRVILAAVIGLVLVAAGVVGWSLSHRGGHPGSPQASGGTSSSSSSSPPSVAASNVLTPVSANSFDPLGSGGNENGDETKYAIDNNPSTFWHTDFYDDSPTFGNLKAGTGLILDMGRPVRLSQVVVQFGTVCCAHVEIEIGNNNSSAASTLATFTQVQSSTNAVGSTTFNVTSSATGRYVLIWITYLPKLAGSSNRYEALIYNVVVHGAAVNQSG